MRKKPIDPLIMLLINRLPPAGSIWPEEARSQWLKTLAANFEFVYATPGPRADSLVEQASETGYDLGLRSLGAK